MTTLREQVRKAIEQGYNTLKIPRTLGLSPEEAGKWQHRVYSPDDAISLDLVAILAAVELAESCYVGADEHGPGATARDERTACGVEEFDAFRAAAAKGDGKT